MPRSGPDEVVTERNIDDVREVIGRISLDHADALELGCRYWGFTNPEGFKGEIIVWHGGRAALVAEAGSHWGRWNDQSKRIVLDNGDIYNESGGVGEDA